MPKLRALGGKDLIKIFSTFGFKEIDQRGSRNFTNDFNRRFSKSGDKGWQDFVSGGSRGFGEAFEAFC